MEFASPTFLICLFLLLSLSRCNIATLQLMKTQQWHGVTSITRSASHKIASSARFIFLGRYSKDRKESLGLVGVTKRALLFSLASLTHLPIFKPAASFTRECCNLNPVIRQITENIHNWAYYPQLGLTNIQLGIIYHIGDWAFLSQVEQSERTKLQSQIV